MDNALFPDSLMLRRIINRHTKDALIDTALRWINLYPITRIGGEHSDEDDNDNEDEYTGPLLDSEDRKACVWSMSLDEYKRHVATRYENMRDSSTKKTIVDRILGADWNTGLSSRQIADLDLAYYSQHASLKNWKALKLDYGNQSASIKAHVDPAKIERAFSHYLGPYFKHHVQIMQEKEMVWIRISIHDGLAPNGLPAPTTIVYFIWFINSEYLLGVTIKVEWREFIMEALLRLFKASEIDEWPLTGKSPTSLAELLLYKDSQGPHSRYRLNQVDENPLSGSIKKRKLEDPFDKYTKGRRDIRAEDMDKIATRDRFVAADFGPNAQPSLQRVDIQLNVPYTTEAKNFSLGRMTRQPFPIKVIIEGSNVIEGIKSLIPLGVAKNPMPKFLTELHSMATNTIIVDLDEENDNKQCITTG
ncbi:centromere protein Chl4/mis15/CENP-N [Gamsiella multidivaricata]|uniref:centromere protein Chl4/mis15/CENP-N n=1 Tax=Gamsiella multidivaricata TaxID=101098 RepID=UPI00221F17F9|nr:centromere protein Chl4/mis15/CENP-N [Gamsiella multidivaricata]KAG0365665.1 hypothetical protein BGZ54_006318 [Gamsiella multidivaricata]KAI7819371.1 centromere protein Chl4/mis15/CENP-N [Gamsiella multidivaricata]